ncbi:MAG: hypothetical protein ABFD66_09180 [Smithella sp.]
MDSVPTYGWATAIVVLIMAIAGPLLKNRLDNQRIKREEKKEAERQRDEDEKEYQEALAAGDNDRAALILRRMLK